MKFRAAVTIVLLLFVSCDKPRSTAVSASHRPLPSVAIAAAPPLSAFSPAPISAGGGGVPLASALKDPPASAADAEGFSWTTLDTRPFTTPRTLKDTHCYFVLHPETGGHGLLGGGTRQYSDFIAMERPAGGGIRFHAEDTKDSVRRIGLPADKVPANTPLLIEIHPSDKGIPVVSVNGHKAGELSPLHSLGHFGVGYVNTRYRGKVGEIRLYQNISPPQAADIALLLKTRWQLPGGLTPPAPECLYDLALLTATSPANRCGPLTLQLAEKSAVTTLVSLSPPTAPLAPNAAYPAGTTVALGRIWAIRAAEDFPANCHFTLPAAATLPAQLLGPSGFYSLLFGTTATAPLQEVAATRPTADGLIHFPGITVRSGFYTLAITQGIPLKSAAAAILIDGAAAESHTLTPGVPVTLTTRDTSPGQLLTLTDAANGLPWYHGPAGDFQLSFRPLRTELTLNASFSLAPGSLASATACTLRLDPAAPRLYPGLIAQVVRRPAEKTVLPATPDDFAPGITWPTDSPLVDTDYPAFRSADLFDSLTTPTSRPRYFHTVLPSLDITPDPKQSAPRKAIHKYPLGDLTKDFPVHARFSGFIIPDRTGPHEFRWESSLPSQIQIAGIKPSAHPSSISLPLADLRPIPLEILLTNHPANSLDSRLLWKRAGESGFTPVPAAALLHPVEPAREKPLGTVTGNFSHRKSDTTRFHADASLPAARPTTAKIDPAYFTDAAHLAETYLHGSTRAGDPAVARILFDFIRSRNDWFRAHPEQFPSGAFGKTYGPDMNLFVALQPFLHACENHPALQSEALAARAEYAQYAAASVLSRSFFSEATHGCNDCYDADHNLAVNFWRAATAIDSPYAWDAATCLFDNHFRFAPGASEGICSDGIIDFHNANGRHIHMSGYGIDWFGRIGISNNRLGTPWAITAEQHHRVAEFLRAYEWFIYQNTTSFVCNGRHNSHQGGPENLANHAGFVLGFPEKAIRPADRQALTDLRQRIKTNPGNSITGHRFFFRNLYTVHRRPDFFIDVKMISPLVGGPETFAGAIPWNMSYGDGVTTLMRHGKEYQNLHRGLDNAAFALGWRKSAKVPADLALWHYRQHPGTTQLDHELRAPDRYRSGGGTLAGGVSDGTLGHCAFHHVNGNAATTFRKLYAFTDDGMAVLTTAITNTSPDKEIHPPDVTFRTNLNQCDWLTDVKVLFQDGTQNILPLNGPGGTFSLPLNQRYWIEHDGIGYLILPTGHEGGAGKTGKLQLVLTTRSPLDPVPGFNLTKEQSDLLAASGLPAKRTAKVLHLSIDHGQKPKDARCAYFVCMNAAKAAPRDWLANPPIQIHSNAPELQSLTDIRDGTTHGVFSQPGELKNAAGELLLATDRPASLMWRASTRSLTAQDPIAACTSDISKMADVLQIRLGSALTKQPGGQAITLELPGIRHPDDRHRGAPVTVPSGP